MKTLKQLLIFILLLVPTLPAVASEGSFYELSSQLTDQDGKKVGIDIFKGHPVVVSMFYSSCNYTCPILIDSLKKLDSKLDANTREKVRILLISFDPQNDTPAALKKLALNSDIDLKRWKLVSPAPDQVRDIAAVLHFTYRQMAEGGFNHTSSLTLLDDSGKIIVQEEGTVQAAESMILHLKKYPFTQSPENNL